MSRIGHRGSSSICSDCSTPDPQWASVNRAVVLCNDCCTIHRGLGRHISQVKSLRKGDWNAMQLAMVQHLVTHGANSIWEHSLLDPATNKQGRRKPNPRDPLHPIKADFIRAKYQFLAFAFKNKDTEVTTLDDLNKQLHASVRTANLETSLRLLSLGADPNYFHPDKGTCALHVASGAGQPMQVELLLVYGGDPGAYDANGKTPTDHARTEKFFDLVDRLQEVQYELTDRLAFFLCGKKPDHRTGQHFIIPELSDTSADFSDLAKTAKSKLQALPNHLFDKLAIDVYDEVDRRENNSIWLSSQSESSVMLDRQTVPFLPVIPEYSSTRNQGRQKLARFNGREFATLIIDILSDAKRRQLGALSPLSNNIASNQGERVLVRGERLNRGGSFSDDEPLYDSVASDEDYASIGDSQSIKDMNEQSKEPSLESVSSLDTDISTSTTTTTHHTPTSPTATTVPNCTPTAAAVAAGSRAKPNHHATSPSAGHVVSVDDYLNMKRELDESKMAVKNLLESNQDLKHEIQLLRNMYRHESMSGQSTPREGVPPVNLPVTNGGGGAVHPPPHHPHLPMQHQHPHTYQHPQQQQYNSRPQSMSDSREQQSHSHSTHYPGATYTKHSTGGSKENTYIDPHDLYKGACQSPSSSNDGIYDNTSGGAGIAAAPTARSSASSQGSGTSALSHTTKSSSRTPSSEGGQGLLSGVGGGCGATPYPDSSSAAGGSSDDLSAGAAATATAVPTQDDVVKKTERITKKIQRLLEVAQANQVEQYPVCGDKIHAAVVEMVRIFPKSLHDSPKHQLPLKQLTSGAQRLRDECRHRDRHASAPTQTQVVIQCAYDIAMAAKQLVVLFE